MKVTNKTNLPDVIYRAMKGSDYSRGKARYSITDIINPPQIRVLREKHKDKIIEDITDRTAMFIGTAVHEKLQRDGDIEGDTEIMEARMFATVNDVIISGALDHYHSAKSRILDFKVTKASKIVWGDFTDYTDQLNSYAVLRRANGFPVKELLIVAFLKDWTLKQAEMDPNYPQVDIVQIPIEVWAEDKAIAYVHDRVRLHIQADEDLTNYPCTKDDRWMRNLRCKKYCNISQWCEQYKQIKKG